MRLLIIISIDIVANNISKTTIYNILRIDLFEDLLLIIIMLFIL